MALACVPLPAMRAAAWASEGLLLDCCYLGLLLDCCLIAHHVLILRLAAQLGSVERPFVAGVHVGVVLDEEIDDAEVADARREA